MRPEGRGSSSTEAAGAAPLLPLIVSVSSQTLSSSTGPSQGEECGNYEPHNRPKSWLFLGSYLALFGLLSGSFWALFWLFFGSFLALFGSFKSLFLLFSGLFFALFGPFLALFWLVSGSFLALFCPLSALFWLPVCWATSCTFFCVPQFCRKNQCP